MAKAKYDYIMDKVSDKDTFKAVMFARQMIREGKNPPIAIRTASRYYDCDMGDVAAFVGQCGGRKRAERIAEKKAKAQRREAKETGHKKAREILIKCIKEHDGKMFFISHEEKRLSEETGYPQCWFRAEREKMREEGVLDWETIKDQDGHVLGTWFVFGQK